MNVDDDARDEGVEDGACRACGLLSRLESAQMQPETPSQCSEVCTYSTPRPDNLRRLMEAKHRVNNDVKD